MTWQQWVAMIVATAFGLGCVVGWLIMTTRRQRRKLAEIETSLRMADHWLGHDFIRPGDVVETVEDDIRLRAWEHVREALAVIDPDGTAGVAVDPLDTTGPLTGPLFRELRELSQPGDSMVIVNSRDPDA